MKTWDCDANRNPLRLTVDASTTPGTDLDLAYQYDDLNRVTAVTQAGLTTRYAYDAGCNSCGGGGGNLVGITRPNGISTTMIYDSASRLMKIRNFNAQTGVALTFDAYTYDSMQKRLSQRDSMGTWTYQYDELDRLTQASHPVLADQTFTHDPAGNRTSLLDERQGTFTSSGCVMIRGVT